MKKIFFVIIGACIIGGLGAGIYLYATQKKSVKSPGVTIQKETPKVKLLLWDDPAGFTFSYVDGLVVDRHDEDQQNYAHISFSHPDHPGGVTVWAKDLPRGVVDAVSWVKKDASLSGSIVFDTTLGGIDAKKILVASPQKQLFVGTVTDGLLFYVEGMLADETYWEGVSSTIVGSFAFTPTSDAPAVSAPATDSAPVDEEEVLE